MDANKYDDGKLMFDLIEPEFEKELAAILTMGAKKYEPYNWRKVTGANSRYYAALRRHLHAYRMGERLDPESKLSHLMHAACNIMFLHYFERKRNEIPNVRRSGYSSSSSDTKLPKDTESCLSDDNEADCEFFRDIRILDKISNRFETHECLGTLSMHDTSDGGIEIFLGPDNSPSDNVAYIRKSTLSRLQRLSDCFISQFIQERNRSDDK